MGAPCRRMSTRPLLGGSGELSLISWSVWVPMPSLIIILHTHARKRLTRPDVWLTGNGPDPWHRTQSIATVTLIGTASTCFSPSDMHYWLYFRCNEKMGRAQERLNETQSVGPSNLEHQHGYYQYNYHSDEGIKSGHRKIKLSRIVNIFIFISLCCIFQ